jgi:hypothetical protein
VLYPCYHAKYRGMELGRFIILYHILVRRGREMYPAISKYNEEQLTSEFI